MTAMPDRPVNDSVRFPVWPEYSLTKIIWLEPWVLCLVGLPFGSLYGVGAARGMAEGAAVIL